MAKSKKSLLNHPTNPYKPQKNKTVDQILEDMLDISFQGRNLGLVFQVWKNMLADDTTILLGMSGAMIPAGMRRIISTLIKYRFIDGLVSTGANLFHDIHETLGNYHYIGSAQADDKCLLDQMVDRIYDTYADEEEFRDVDKFIGDYSKKLYEEDASRSWSTREFMNRLGGFLCEKTGSEDGILTSAYKAGIPVYCPSVADSSIGIGIATNRMTTDNKFSFDVIKDVEETAKLVVQSKNTGVAYIGGGVPKNFIQQTEVTSYILDENVCGHKYAIQIIVDPPHWGGLSGCTFEEAQSWGKIHKEAKMATVYLDATIGLTFISQGLVEAYGEEAENLKHRKSYPLFSDLDKSDLIIQIKESV